MKKVVILGSTGSIGRQTLNVIAKNKDKFRVVGLSCEKNIETLKEQKKRFDVKYACCKRYADEFDNVFDNELKLVQTVDFDILVAGSGGIDSLDAVEYSLRAGKRVCIANKELLVCYGKVLTAISNGNIIPVDSEHSAVFQCLKDRNGLRSITLTCSGGALRNYPIEKLQYASKSDVLNHPTWQMGDKITVDCATMVNKAFEVIEAMRLFDLPKEKINVLLHKESLVHGFATFDDGSIICQIAKTDMELPIAYALSYPERLFNDDNFSLVGKSLSFDEPDYIRYPLFDYIRANCDDDAFCCLVSGADESAVNLFLDGCITYGQLHTIIEKATKNVPSVSVCDTDTARRLYYEGYNRVLEIGKKI